MDQATAQALLEDYAARPSQKSWEWIRGAIQEAPEASRQALIEAAEALVRDWPAVLLDGSGRRDDRVLSIHQRWEREVAPDSPLWKLVRSYTLHNPTSLPSKPLSELTVSGFSDNAAAVAALLSWPHFSTLEVLRFERWNDEGPARFRQLLNALQGARLRGLHLIDVSSQAAVVACEILATTAWPALQALSLTPARVPKEAFEALLEAVGPNLAELSLTGRVSSDIASVIARNCSKLERLEARFEASALAAFCESTPKLSTLRVGSSKLGPDDCRAIGNHLKALEELELRDQPFGDAGFEALAESENLSQLRVLRLQDCDLRKSGLEAWAARPASSLAELDLTANDELDGEAVVQLCESSNAEHLRSLSLEASRLRESDFDRIARCSTLAKLDSLTLRGANLNKKILDRLLTSPAAQGLQALDLGYPTDRRRRLKDVKPFVAASALCRLRRLGLAGHDLGHAFGVVEALAASEYLKELEELDLSNNQPEAPIEDYELEELRDAGLPRLREIESGGD